MILVVGVACAVALVVGQLQINALRERVRELEWQVYTLEDLMRETRRTINGQVRDGR
jgi:hypothetical protein